MSLKDRNKIKIYIVEIVNSEYNFENLHMLAHSLSKNEIQIEYLTSNESSKFLDAPSNSIFIVEPYDDYIYSLLSVDKKYSVFGWRSVFYCLESKIALPKIAYPLYCMELEKYTFCYSGIMKSLKNELVNLIQMMGGKVSSNLTTSVTHLLTYGKQTTKLQVSKTIEKIKIITPHWIHDMWKTVTESKQHILIMPDPTNYQKFLFENCKVCITGCTFEQRKDIKLLVENHGGVYYSELNPKICTHLIVTNNNSDKHRCAMKWKIPCVTLNWFYDSINSYQLKNVENYTFFNNSNQTISYMNSSTSDHKDMIDIIDKTNISFNDTKTLQPISAIQTDVASENQSDENSQDSSSDRLKQLLIQATQFTQTKRPPSSIITNENRYLKKAKEIESLLLSTTLNNQKSSSQNETIVYDDPIGRIEREKILNNTHKPNVNMNFDNIQSIQAPSIKEISEQLKPYHYHNSSIDASNKKGSNFNDNDFILTSANVELITNSPYIPSYIFLLSGMTSQEKNDYSILIEKLGGKILDTQFFSKECTHLIIGIPTKTEKFLSSIASGKWILKKSFIEDSRIAGRFVSECDHEWGGELNPTKLTLSCRRWRLKIQNDKVGAFNNWIVYIIAEPNRLDGLRRLLISGGAIVDTTFDENGPHRKYSHLFTDSLNVVPAIFIEKKYPIIKTEYIMDYLTNETTLSIDKYKII